MTIVAVDFGKKRLGLAVAESGQAAAYPLATIDRRSLKLDLNEVRRCLVGRDVSRIVVGLPLSMDGGEGSIARAARNFGIRLAEFFNLPVDFQDERLSSFEADQRMGSSITGRRRKAARDSIAATVILEGWLETHRDSR